MKRALTALGKLAGGLAWLSLLAGAFGVVSELWRPMSAAESIGDAFAFFAGLVVVILRQGWVEWRIRPELKAMEMLADSWREDHDQENTAHHRRARHG